MLCRPARPAVSTRRIPGCCTCAAARWSSQLASLAQQRRPAARMTAPSLSLRLGGIAPPLPPAVPFVASKRGVARRAARSPTVRRVERQQAAARSPPPPPPRRSAAPDSSERADDAAGAAGAVTDTDRVLVLALDRAIAALGLFAFASRDECVAALAASRRVLQGRTTASDAVLQRENLSAYKIHSLAVLLLFGGSSLPATDAGGGDSSGAQCFSLAMALLHLAAASGTTAATPSPSPGGYLPATLTILNMFGVDASGRKSRVGAKMRQSRMYQAAEKQFVAYIAASQRPASPSPSALTDFDVAMRANAFTLAGVLAEAAGDPMRALRWYGAAQAAGQAVAVASPGPGEDGDDGGSGDDVRPREPLWDWEARCLVALGRLLPPGAERERALRTAALALGSGEACMLLAAAYAQGEEEAAVDGPQRQDEIDALLHQAAVGDVPGAMDALAAREERRAALCAKTAAHEAAEHRLLAAEWRQLAAAAAATAADVSA